ncbi:MAG: nuclease-related domain-containing protein [Candidatus Bathyarchaeia archaeon]
MVEQRTADVRTVGWSLRQKEILGIVLDVIQSLRSRIARYSNRHLLRSSAGALIYIFQEGLIGINQVVTRMHIVKESGNHLRRKVQIAQLMFVVCVVALAILVLISIPKMPLYFNAGAYEGARALSMVFPTVGIFFFLRMYRSYRLGVEGEEKVTSLLQRSLDDYYFLVNDVVYSDSWGKKRNIDHVLLGPNAVFAIETKNWTRLYFDPTDQAQRNAQWVWQTIVDSKVLGDRKFWVQGVVVFLNFLGIRDLSTEKVKVLGFNDLVGFITSHGRDRFSLQEMEAMGKILSRPTR